MRAMPLLPGCTVNPTNFTSPSLERLVLGAYYRFGVWRRRDSHSDQRLLLPLVAGVYSPDCGVMNGVLENMKNKNKHWAIESQIISFARTMKALVLVSCPRRIAFLFSAPDPSSTNHHTVKRWKGSPSLVRMTNCTILYAILWSEHGPNPRDCFSCHFSINASVFSFRDRGLFPTRSKI